MKDFSHQQIAKKKTKTKKTKNPKQSRKAFFQLDSYVYFILIIFYSPIKWVNRKLLLSFDKYSN